MPILEDEKKRQEIIELLTVAYWMEIETVMNYISSSVNLDGVRAELTATLLAEMERVEGASARIVHRPSSDAPTSFGRSNTPGRA